MGSVVGDVGVQFELNEGQAVQQAQRVAQSLLEVDRVTQKLSADIDKAIWHLANTSEAVQGIRKIAEAQKEEADAARKAAEEHRKHAEALAQKQQALSDMRQGLMQIGAAASAMAYAIKSAADEAIEAFKAQEQAMRGLEAISTKTIGSFSGAKEAAEELASDGLMTLTESSKALQAALATGFNLDQAKELIQISKDAAAFNRQQNFGLGEAVVRTLEGVKMGLSNVADAVGITRNLSDILREQGKSEQDVMNIQSDASVRQALLNGWRKEGAIYAGNAAKAAELLAGSEAKAASATFTMRAAVGEALAPALQSAHGAMLPLARSITAWTQENPELARGIFLVAGGVAAFTGAMALATAAVMSFKLAIGKLGIGIVIGSAAIGALAGYAANVVATGQAAERTQSQLARLVDQYERARSVVDDATASVEDHQRASDELRSVIEEIARINPELVSGFDVNTEALRRQNEQLDASIEKYRNLKEAWEWIDDHILSFVTGRTDEQTYETLEKRMQWLQDLYDKATSEEAKQGLLLQMRTTGAQMLALRSTTNFDDPESKIQELATRPNLAPDGRTGATATRTSTGVSSTGGTKMSPVLAATLEDLADLQALERTPENLKRTLEKVQEILKAHKAELVELGRDRELTRLAEIILPKEIMQADYQAALQDLNAKQQLGKITPTEFREGLEAIQERFAVYLEQNPDLALQLQLRIQGATDEELQAPLEAWRRAHSQFEAIGQSTQERLDSLRKGLSLALAAGDMDTAFSLAGQIKQAEAALQQARFEEKFNAIADARDRAFASSAEPLAKFEKDLIDEEAKGDQADPARVAEIRQQMLDAVRPALEAQRAALEELLKDTTLTADQREQVERELTQVKAELYDQDVSAHRIAADAKTAAERQAAEEKQKLIQQQRTWLEELAEMDLNRIRERNQAEQTAQRNYITGLQNQLSALERIWAAEDRQSKKNDLRAELAAVKADTRFLKIDANGNQVYTYDEERAREIEKQIADAERDDQRARTRERLQSQITAAQASLQAMQTAHQNEEAERQRFWATIEATDLTKYADLTSAAEQGLGTWASAFSTALSGMLTEAQTKAQAINDALRSIGNVSGLSLPTIVAPTLPASLGASIAGNTTTVATVPQVINVYGATNPQATAAAVAPAAQQGAQSGVSDAVRGAREAWRSGPRPY